MKTKIAVILMASLVAMVSVKADVVTNQVPNLITNSPTVGIGTTINLNLSATNWVVIPFAIYDTSTKKFGEGAAILYQATTALWAGVRVQNINSQKTEAGVQAQLQLTYKVGSFTIHPFLETSVGIGSSSMYGSVGPGAWINLHSWTFSNGDVLNVGLIGDYEHYVYGQSNGNDIDGGFDLNLCW